MFGGRNMKRANGKYIFILIVFTLILFSCYRQETNKTYRQEMNEANVKNRFMKYNWGTNVSQIINELGEPKLTQNFQQYGTEVSYLWFGEEIIYGYNTIYWYTFIEDELVGGGYWIISPSTDNTENITGSVSAYKDLQKRITILYGKPSTTSEFLDSVWNKNKDIPDNSDELSDKEFISLLPFETTWNDGGSFITLSLNYDEYYITKIDIMGPKIVHLIDLELAEQFNKFLEEN
jgi:hypothetical protein